MKIWIKNFNYLIKAIFKKVKESESFDVFISKIQIIANSLIKLDKTNKY
jgi:hypothetical protein